VQSGRHALADDRAPRCSRPPGCCRHGAGRIRWRNEAAHELGAGGSAGVAFLRVFDASCEALELFHTRHGAQLAVLRCDHPDIEAFIDAKARGALPHFKLSVGVTDAFMHAVEACAQVDLVHRAAPAESGTAVRRDDGLFVYRRANAAELWQRMARAAYDHGEPGVLYLDRINIDNNLAYCETIACVSASGEQPLPPYGACCLGSIDLTQFVAAPFSADARFDFDAFAAVVPVAVRMLDDVLEVTSWPLPQQRDEALSQRRVGLGFTGLADTLVMLGLHYDSDPARETAAHIARTLRDAAYAASIDLARERGPFPRFDADGLLREGAFASRLTTELQSSIREHGLRNSHLLCA
jgi:ribonucleoside-diphosphate reductase alpha chain